MDRLPLWKISLRQGRKVFAVPGPVTASTSQGTHQLLRQGAGLITCAEDIVEALPQLRLAAAPAVELREPDGRLPEPERRALACVSDGEPREIDRIAQDSGMGLAELASSLLSLELKRCIVQLPGQRYIRQRPRAG